MCLDANRHMQCLRTLSRGTPSALRCERAAAAHTLKLILGGVTANETFDRKLTRSSPSLCGNNRKEAFNGPL